MIEPSNASKEQLPLERALSSIRPTLHALLAQFNQAAEKKTHHRVMFVSPESGDGTTTLATGAALMLVRHFRQKVALVEANLYSPAMAAFLDIDPGPGLIEVADGSAEASAAVRNSKLHGLYVLTAGGGRTPAQGELAEGAIQNLLAGIAGGHRFTIIDAPPVLEHPETCLLLEHVDEVLLVVRAGSTHGERAKAAVRIIEDAGGKVGGVFLNRYKADMPFGIGRHREL